MSFYWKLPSSTRAQRPFPSAVQPDSPAEEALFPKWRHGTNPIENLTEDETKELSVLLEDFQSHPWPKGKRDATWLATARAVTDRLEAFWDGVSKVKQRKVDSNDDDFADATEPVAILSECTDDSLRVEFDDLENGLEAQRTQALPAGKDPIVSNYVEQKVWGEIPLTRRAPTTTDERPQKRCRIPRQRLADSDSDEHMSDAAKPDDDAIVSIQIPVNRNTLSLIPKLHPSKDHRDGSKSVQWQDFNKALVDMDFDASHVGGSAVQFNGGHGTIVFHKPHPEATYSAVQVRGCGKRLAWRFGFGVEEPEVGGEMS